MKEEFPTLYDRIFNEHQKLETQIRAIQTTLNGFPEGKLICSHDGSHCKWYQSDGHRKIYLPKKNRKQAEQLAAKKYLSLVLEDLLHEKKALELYLNHHRNNTGKAERLLTDIPGYRELLAPFFSPQSRKLSDWQNSVYERNPNYPEQLVHKTSSGNLVRSKSEAIIDLHLYTNRIPFRYECALHLGNITLFPDFTVQHPKTGKLYYWEHFGLMDDPSYVQNACSKIQLYSTYDIIPSVNLITTFETREHPLSSELVEKIIAYYFL